MLGPIILSSKTEILALKELVIMLMKVYKQKESRGRKIELSNLRCQLSREYFFYQIPNCSKFLLRKMQKSSQLTIQ